MRTLFRRRPLLSFFAVSYALSWAYWVPMALAGARVAPGSAAVTHVPGLVGPALSAFIVALLAGDRRQLVDLVQRLYRLPPPRWVSLGYSLSPLAFLLVALGAVLAAGAPMPSVADFSRFSGLPDIGLLPVFLLAFVIGGFGEEAGWRGFALPRLQQRFGSLGGPVVLAVFWAAWHTPTFFVIDTYRAMSPVMIAGGFVFGLTCGSIVLARVCNRTGGSVLAASLWHVTYNMTSATAASRGIVASVTTTCVIAWAVVLVAGEWRRRGGAVSLLRVPPPETDVGLPGDVEQKAT